MAQQGTIIALSVSAEKGTPKTNVPEVRLIEAWGIDGDAHAGDWHRQVSLLALSSIETMRARGATVRPGIFAENITTDGLDLLDLQIGNRLNIGDALLEITQIGKTCHNRCAIYQQVGDCVMPREGIFARVITGGVVRVGDTIDIAKTDVPCNSR
ncbi:MAG: MOSC domain-containing protein [Armatimonadota bacterium]